MSKSKQVIIAVVIGIAVIVILGGIKGCQIWSAMSGQASFGPPPETVTTLVVQPVVWRDSQRFVGSLSAVNGVTLKAEEAGKVVAINFKPGMVVEQGALLVELESSVEKANLAAARARLERNQLTLNRVQKLKGPGAISQDTLEQAEFGLAEARADAASIEALIERKNIIAPFKGKLGIRMVNLGQYLSPGQEVVPLQAFDELFLDFSVPQQFVGKVSNGDQIRFEVDSFPGQVFHASICSIDPEVNQLTRQVRVQGLYDNSNNQLRAGMFVSIELELPGEKQVFAIPQSSINYAPYGNSVYVVHHPEKPKVGGEVGQAIPVVYQQIVKLDGRKGDQIAVIDGLKAGDEIVTSGVFKLHPESKIMINNKLAPENNPAPTVSDS